MWLPCPMGALRSAVFVALSAPACALAATGIPPAKAVITLTPKFGPVTFAHQRHSELDGVSCVTCHHTMGPAEDGIQSCYVCHEAQLFRIAAIKRAEIDPADERGPQVPNAQEAFHGLCTSCHHHRRTQDFPAGPDESCRDCHA